MSQDDSSQATSRADERANGADGDEPRSTRSEADTTSDVSGEDAEPGVALSPEDELDAARSKSAENYDLYVRAKADIENIRKRHQRELADRARYDGESLARDIVPAIDDLERALEHAGDGAAGVTDGIELVRKGLMAALKRNGVERIEAEGKPFDPAEHEAVTVVETDEVPPNTVISVFRAGYKIRDRLLRAAMVSVSKAPESKA
ncbi:MAG TPA: nucleotide exchange factor GrpE [Candidatus Limnocylindrales bacterium]|nr:nucleotide exchange factor GrpE [Candidatus Limnocylindrales bacterium]